MIKPELDFDLTFRPDYWAPSDPISLIIANVKGEARRIFILEALRPSDPSAPARPGLPDDLCVDTLAPEDREQWGLLHPQFMGGEYLPDYRRGEIEIARIVLASSTMDVASVRARRSRDLRIHYRVVDEYETTFAHHPLSSKHPLSFAQLISLLDSIRQDWDEPGREYITWCMDSAFDRTGHDPATYSHFVTVESTFYPQLEAFYCWRNDQWLANKLAASAARGGDAREPGSDSHTRIGRVVVL